MPYVLIIEDDPSLRRMLALTLKGEGFAVNTAWNGREGLELIDSREPDAIVLDLRMPVMDGPTFFRELRARGVGTPVLILSAYDARKAQRELGADAYVQKPFEADRLVEKLRGLVGGNSG
jgi:two-component system, OmpR family, response regulator